MGICLQRAYFNSQYQLYSSNATSHSGSRPSRNAAPARTISSGFGDSQTDLERSWLVESKMQTITSDLRLANFSDALQENLIIPQAFFIHRCLLQLTRHRTVPNPRNPVKRITRTTQKQNDRVPEDQKYRNRVVQQMALIFSVKSMEVGCGFVVHTAWKHFMRGGTLGKWECNNTIGD